MPDDDWVRWIAAPVLAVASTASYAAQYLTVEQAQQLMFGASARFERRDLELDPQIVREIERRSGVRVRVREQPLWQVSREGERAGYFIVDEVIGKHELITYALALAIDGRVRQIEILSYRENYGYEIRNAAWRAQFTGKSAADALLLDRDIKNISGATLSCRHVTEGVRRLLVTYELLLRES